MDVDLEIQLKEVLLKSKKLTEQSEELAVQTANIIEEYRVIDEKRNGKKKLP
jgi:hypothetical protein